VAVRAVKAPVLAFIGTKCRALSEEAGGPGAGFQQEGQKKDGRRKGSALKNRAEALHSEAVRCTLSSDREVKTEIGGNTLACPKEERSDDSSGDLHPLTLKNRAEVTTHAHNQGPWASHPSHGCE